VQVSEELIRVAILWHEQWHEGLEEASRLYFGEHDTKGMFGVLEPLHQMIEKGPTTLKETSFIDVRDMELDFSTHKQLKYKFLLLYHGNLYYNRQTWPLCCCNEVVLFQRQKTNSLGPNFLFLLWRCFLLCPYFKEFLKRSSTVLTDSKV